jgi:hypothetical protein
MTKLLAISTDAKTIKGEKLGVLTGIVYLAPADTTVYDVCPNASPGCKNSCLFTAGRGAYNSVQIARIEKTNLLFTQRDTFMSILVTNIRSLAKKAEKRNMVPAVRLNGTSDIPWERISLVVDGKWYPNIMSVFPDIEFYDYTKIASRAGTLLPNYNLTFSITEDNMEVALKLLARGINVAVVMRLGKTDPKPTSWRGFPVVDGDVSDVRFIDPRGCWVALIVKGKAKKDTTGFVYDA